MYGGVRGGGVVGGIDIFLSTACVHNNMNVMLALSIEIGLNNDLFQKLTAYLVEPIDRLLGSQVLRSHCPNHL